MEEHHGHDHRPTIYHATSPLCAWSWGYEPVLNRIRLVYGDQVPIRLLYQAPHESVEGWFEEYGMTEEESLEWLVEIRDTIGLPMKTDMRKKDWAPSAVPGTLAALAAQREDHRKSERLAREMLRRYCVGGEDVTKEATLIECVRAAGLDVARFQKLWQDEAALQELLEHQGEGHHWPHVPLTFYNLVVSDGHRHVILEHAFDPAGVESAIDWLGGGKLQKRQPTDVAAYLAAHGAAPKEEIAKVFAMTPAKAEAALGDLEKQGKASATTIGGATFWAPKGK